MNFEKTVRRKAHTYRGLESPGGDPDKYKEAYEDYFDQVGQNYYQLTRKIFDVSRYSASQRALNLPKAEQPDNRKDVRIACVSSDIGLEGQPNGYHHRKSPIGFNEDQAASSTMEHPQHMDAHDTSDIGLPIFRTSYSQNGYNIIEPTESYSRQEVVDARLEELNVAIDNFNPDIISFGEFAHPVPITEISDEIGQPLLPTDDLNSTVHRLSSYGLTKREFEVDVQNRLLQENENRTGRAFVCLGSYHCLESYFHNAVILPHGSDFDSIYVRRRRRTATGVADPNHMQIDIALRLDTESIPVSPPINHLKKFPARRIGEATRTPSGTSFNIYRTAIGSIAVLICSDLIDLNQFVGLIEENLKVVPDHKGGAKIDYILIPCFNDSPILYDLCEQLSFMTGAVVIMNNKIRDEVRWAPDGTMTLNETPTKPCTNVFIAGRAFNRYDGEEGLRHQIVDVPRLRQRSCVHQFTIDKEFIRVQQSLSNSVVKRRIGGVGMLNKVNK